MNNNHYLHTQYNHKILEYSDPKYRYALMLKSEDNSEDLIHCLFEFEIDALSKMDECLLLSKFDTYNEMDIPMDFYVGKIEKYYDYVSVTNLKHVTCFSYKITNIKDF